MAFLQWIAKIAISKLLEFLKDLALKYGARRIKKNKDQGHADAINEVVAEIYMLEDLIELMRKDGLTITLELEKIIKLELRLRDLSKMDSTIN